MTVFVADRLKSFRHCLQKHVLTDKLYKQDGNMYLYFTCVIVNHSVNLNINKSVLVNEWNFSKTKMFV